MSEYALQCAVVGYLTVACPRGSGVVWTHFPAGGGGRIRGAMLKRAGLRPGMPDIVIFHNERTFFIELKTDKGRLSPIQSECHADLWAAGFPVAVARSVDDVARLLASWRIPTRIKTEAAA